MTSTDKKNSPGPGPGREYDTRIAVRFPAKKDARGFRRASPRRRAAEEASETVRLAASRTETRGRRRRRLTPSHAAEVEPDPDRGIRVEFGIRYEIEDGHDLKKDVERRPVENISKPTGTRTPSLLSSSNFTRAPTPKWMGSLPCSR